MRTVKTYAIGRVEGTARTIVPAGLENDGFSTYLPGEKHSYTTPENDATGSDVLLQQIQASEPF